MKKILQLPFSIVLKQSSSTSQAHSVCTECCAGKCEVLLKKSHAWSLALRTFQSSWKKKMQFQRKMWRKLHSSILKSATTTTKQQKIMQTVFVEEHVYWLCINKASHFCDFFHVYNYLLYCSFSDLYRGSHRKVNIKQINHLGINSCHFCSAESFILDIHFSSPRASLLVHILHFVSL